MTYNSGFVLRDSLSGGDSWTSSPDIIPYGTAPAVDPSIFVSQYDQDQGQSLTLDQPNWIYVRGKNASAGAFTAQTYLYYAQNNTLLVPPAWQSFGILYQGQPDTPAPLSASASGEVAVINLGFVWVPRQPTGPDQSYMLIAWTTTPDQPDPLDWSNVNPFSTPQDLQTYLQQNPNMAIRQTTLETPKSGDTPYSTGTYPLKAPSQQSELLIGVQCTNMPTDGFVAFSVPGPDAVNTIVMGKTPICNGNMALLQAVTFPPNFQTSITYTHWKGNTQPPTGSNITPIVVPMALVSQGVVQGGVCAGQQ